MQDDRRTDLDAVVRDLVARNQDLEKALEETRTALEQSRRAEQVRNTFLSLVSHELRTPLTIISTYLQVLSRDPGGTLAAKQQEQISKTLRASGRLRDLIESVLEYARIQEGLITLSPEPIDLVSSVRAQVEELRYQAEQKQLELRFCAPSSELPGLTGDPRLLRLIVSNLVSNAIKYTERGAIDVGVGHADATHRLWVRDTGPGIPDHRHRAAADPLGNIDVVSHRLPPGIGVGLALVREITLAIGGRLELESAPGAGSTFTVVMPPLTTRSAPAPGST